MGCAYEKNGDEITIFCGKKIKPCVICGQVADYLCDYLLENGKTCDKQLCATHAGIVGDNLEYCPEHYKVWLDAAGKKIVNVKRFKGKIGCDQRKQIGVPRRAREKMIERL